MLMLLSGSAIFRHGNLTPPSDGPRQCKAAKKTNEDQARICAGRGGPKWGRPLVDAELILLTMSFRLREGCSWRALSIFAPHSTIFTCWKAWCESGVWDRILGALAKQGAAGSSGRSIPCAKVDKHPFGGPQGAEVQCMGGPMEAPIPSPRLGRRPRASRSPALALRPRPARQPLGPSACRRTEFQDDPRRQGLRQRRLQGISGVARTRACIRSNANESDSVKYHKGLYGKHHHVENFFLRVKEFCTIPTDFEKLGSRFLCPVELAALCDWLRK